MNIHGMGMQMSYGMGNGFPMRSMGGGGPSFEDMASRLMTHKDADSSGTLSMDEISISEEAFAAADTDENGELNLDELIDYGPEMKDALRSQGMGRRPPGMHKMGGGQPSVEDMVSRLMENTDADENGTLSNDEIGVSEGLFAQVDTDEDGELNTEELTENATVLRDALGAKHLMENRDANQDGVLSADEIDIPTEIFDEVDTDGDGTISMSEAEAGAEQLRPDKPLTGVRRGGGPGRGGGIGKGFGLSSGMRSMGSLQGISLYSLFSESYFTATANRLNILL